MVRLLIEIIDKDIVENFLLKLDKPETRSPDSTIDFSFNFNDRNVYQVKTRLFELLDGAKQSVSSRLPYFGDPDVTKKIIECADRA
jgi:hypothetical protein